MTALLTVMVRAGSDASAVKSALRPHYGEEGLGYEVLSAGGVRGDKLVDRVIDVSSRRRHYVVVLLGREDGGLADEIMALRPHDLLAAVVLRKRKVRNARQAELLRAVELGKAVIRNSVRWSPGDGCYVFSDDAEELRFPKDAVSDPFMIYGRGLKALSALIGAGVEGSALLIRREGGKHLVFVKNELIAELRFNDEGSEPAVLRVDARGAVLAGPDPGCVSRANEVRLSLIESAGTGFLEGIGRRLGTSVAIVPLSGGKDSAAALNLAVRVFGSDAVRAVYVDTGVDFTINREHAEALASSLGVELSVVKAPVREWIAAGRRPPTHGNRWCTRLKVEALQRYCTSLAAGRKALVVTGARDSESRARELEPYVGRFGENLYKVSPVRHWSTLECQAYCMARNLRLNPLYELGFYRIGCFICPSLRSWERFVMRLFRDVVNRWMSAGRPRSSNKS